MDDAQGIVLLALKRAGVEVPEDVQSVTDLRPKQLFPIYAKALALLRGAPLAGFPAELPQQRAERFRVSADLVALFKELGYHGDLSFHQFLYPSDADKYRLLRFLLDKLSHTGSSSRSRGPRKIRTGRIGVDDIGGSKISATVHNALSLCLEEFSLFAVAYEKENKSSTQVKEAQGRHGRLTLVDGKLVSQYLPFRTCPLRLASSRDVNKKVPALITLQVKPKMWLIPSIIELNGRNVEKAARLADAQLAHLARHADGASSTNKVSGRNVVMQGVLLPTRDSSSEYGSANLKNLLAERSARAARFGGEANRSKSEALHIFSSREYDTGAQAEKGIIASEEGTNAEVLKNKKQLSGLEENLLSLARQASEVTGEVAALKLKEERLRVSFESSIKQDGILGQNFLVMRTAVDLALHSSESPAVALQELQSKVLGAELRLAALQAEWEAVKSRLEEKVDVFEKMAETRNSVIQAKLRKIKEMRQEVKEMTVKMQDREVEEAHLSAEVEKLVRGATRATYVRRITELIRNSKKQDADIARIISETRDLQRESNAAQDRLRRLYALVDETVFRDAKKDPVCRQTYKLLSSVHQNFAEIVNRVLEMDKIGREISELHAKLEDLDKRTLDEASVQADLDAVVMENRALEKKLGEVASFKKN